MECCTLSTSLPPAGTPAQPAPRQALGFPGSRQLPGARHKQRKTQMHKRARVSSLPRSLPTPRRGSKATLRRMAGLCQGPHGTCAAGNVGGRRAG